MSSRGPAAHLPAPRVVVVMGVSGSGKSTVGALLARQLGWRFQEGDALHPDANIEKLTAGHALDDADRAPWLARIAAWIDACLDAGDCGVVTCSALKRRYRDVLAHGRDGVLFAYLDGPRETIVARLADRKGHFMPPGLLASQFDTLEVPLPAEPAVMLDARESPQALATRLVEVLRR